MSEPGEAFHADMLAAPRMTLRGSYAEDSYEYAPAPDANLDTLTDSYLETYTFWGLAYLDPASWRHYLPCLIDYTFRHMGDPKMVVEGLLHNLRPPDREPPRLASLTAEQEAVVVDFLEEVAFSADLANRDFRCRCWRSGGCPMSCSGRAATGMVKVGDW